MLRFGEFEVQVVIKKILIFPRKLTRYTYTGITVLPLHLGKHLQFDDTVMLYPLI